MLHVENSRYVNFHLVLKACLNLFRCFLPTRMNLHLKIAYLVKDQNLKFCLHNISFVVYPVLHAGTDAIAFGVISVCLASLVHVIAVSSIMNTSTTSIHRKWNVFGEKDFSAQVEYYCEQLFQCAEV